MLSSYLMMGQTLTVSETQQVPISTSAASIETFILDAFDTSINYKVSLSSSGSANGTFSVNTTTVA
jgi:hypothetical protein